MKSLVLPLLLGLLSASVANADIISVTNSTPATVDAATTTRTVLVNAPGQIVDLATISVNFTKTDGGSGGFTYNNEIYLQLTSPLGTTITLVAPGSYSGQNSSSANAVVLFSDSAAGVVGGPLLVSGNFQPVGNLSDFIGQLASGTWTLTITDTVGLDPLTVHSFTLNLITSPEPASMLAWGLIAGIGAVGCRLRQRKVKAA